MAETFSHKLEVRFRDCDAMGHVNNAVYLTYLEQARLAYWRSVWGSNYELMPDGMPGTILARAEIDYRKPAKYDDVLEIRMALEKIGRSSIASTYEVVDQTGAVVATARTVLVMFDYKSNKPVPVPDDLRSLLSRTTS